MGVLYKPWGCAWVVLPTKLPTCMCFSSKNCSASCYLSSPTRYQSHNLEEMCLQSQRGASKYPEPQLKVTKKNNNEPCRLSWRSRLEGHDNLKAVVRVWPAVGKTVPCNHISIHHYCLASITTLSVNNSNLYSRAGWFSKDLILYDSMHFWFDSIHWCIVNSLHHS